MTRVTVNAEAIPARFKERERWLLWDKSNDTPRQPHWDGNFGVSWSNSDDWHSFEEAIELANEHATWGVGYVFRPDDDEFMIDVDGPYDDGGVPRDWVPEFETFAGAGAYMEWSPSGNGIHIPVEGEPPVWWRDSEVDPDLHQGVDVLENKFCTFTGDEHDDSGAGFASASNAAQFLFHAYKNIRGESPRLQDDEDSDEYDGDDEWLDDELVAKALDAIDPDLPHSEWIRLAYAVCDYDNGSNGRRLFEDWSKQSEKWDSGAKRSVETVWDDGSQNVTVATLIHKAKESGWSAPSRPSGGESTGPDPEEVEQEHGHDSWSYVRALYDDEQQLAARQRATEVLEKETAWMYVLESELLWVYDSDTGYFNPWGEAHSGHVLESRLGSFYTQGEKREIIGRLEDRNQTHREVLNARTREGYYVCVGNGVVDLTTGEFHDHSPEYKFTRGLEWDWDPATADPEPVLGFLDDLTRRETDRDTILDHLAHGLMPGHPYRAFVMMYGPGSNGKTRLGALLRQFVGEDNAASVELQDLTGDDDFATGGLPGAFVNVGDDVSISELRDVSLLKSVTGGGTVRANEKYEKKYDFENEAAMFFSANEPPRIAEESDAIGDRLYPIEMPFRFVDDTEYEEDNDLLKRKDPRVVEKLVNDDAAMRGLLLLAVKHAQDLIESHGQYSMPEGPRQRREMYEAASDPIHRFALDYLEDGDGDEMILKDDAYTVYKALCDREDERVTSEQVFKSQISQQSLVDVESGQTRTLSPGESPDTCWRYVRFGGDARDLMPSRLVSRYFPDEEEMGDAETESDAEEADDAFGAKPIADAATSLTGYVSVTVEVAKVREIGDNGAVKATVKDTTGAMDVVAWDSMLAAQLDSLEEEYAAIQHAEVQEYEGTRELVVDEAISEVTKIQRGIGFTEGPSPGSGQDDLESAATDGGSAVVEDETEDEAEDDDDIADVRPRVARHLSELPSGKKVRPASLAGELNEEPGAVREALKRIKSQDSLLRAGAKGFETL